MGYMDFSLRRINGENIHYSESETESDIQLIFTPGSFNPEIWKNQLRYFSKKYKTIAFKPTESFRDFEGEKKGLKAILDKEEVENAVLISNTIGNSVVSSFTSHESVQSTVLTGFGSKNLPNKNIYKAFWWIAKRKPKILRKTLFSKFTDYRVLKQFMKDLEIPEYENIISFTNKDMVGKDKLSLIINSEEDYFSNISEARKMKARLSMIKRAGTFSFYEKPQDYNKALNDFLDIIEEKVRQEEIVESAENNRSLIEFDKNDLKEVELKK